jgi:photosystem II stability/assembly factor-like uncharacterized protein
MPERVYHGVPEPGISIEKSFRPLTVLGERHGVFPPTVLSCLTNKVCFGLSHGMWRTTDGGRSWSIMAPVREVPDVFSCSSSVDCAVGTSAGSVDFTIDGGRRWTRSALPGAEPTVCSTACDSTYFVTGIACSPTGQTCIVTIAYRQLPASLPPIFETTDRGRSWSSMSLPTSPYLELLSLACVHGGVCWAGGQLGDHRPTLLRLGHDAWAAHSS